MSTRNLFEQFISGFAHAIGDIRQKVVEEGWFGRTTTPPLHTTELGWIMPEDRAEKSAIDHAVGWVKDPSEPAEKYTTFIEREVMMGWYRPAHELPREPEHDHEHGLDR